MGNGLKNFGFHAEDPAAQPASSALRRATAAVSAARPSDPESAARGHLSRALAADELPELVTPTANGVPCEFRILGTEAQPLTNTTTVKFRQTFNKIPVYGSLVTVELDENNDLLAIHSAMGQPLNVDPVAHVSPAEAARALQAKIGNVDPVRNAPRLCFYFDDAADRWRLVYVFEDLPAPRTPRSKIAAPAPLLMDYVVDAHSGAEVAALPRTPSAGAFQNDSASDELGQQTDFICFVSNDGKRHLQNDRLNLHTHDLRFGDIYASSLPGGYATNPPSWSAGAVSAHANAAKVGAFLAEVLHRNGVDGLGGKLVSSVNCVVEDESSDGTEWRNAAWYRGQMVYGQRKVAGQMRSYAAALDVVAHEVFHGVTDHTARLQYARQPGALNESYSDIFGIIVSNVGNPDPRRWNWELGEDLDGTGVPLRDLSNPAKYRQPDHMQNYQNRPNTQAGDWGGVHTNSGIHNFAAFKIMTAEDEDGGALFTAAELASVFYLALTQYLSRTSQFSDARRATELVARTLFRNEQDRVKDRKLQAVSSAFEAVGIV